MNVATLQIPHPFPSGVIYIVSAYEAKCLQAAYASAENVLNQKFLSILRDHSTEFR